MSRLALLLLLAVGAPAAAQTRPEAKDQRLQRARRAVAAYVTVVKDPRAAVGALEAQARARVAKQGHARHEHPDGECRALRVPSARALRVRALRAVRAVAVEAIPAVRAALAELPPSPAAELLWAVHRAKDPAVLELLQAAAAHPAPVLRQAAAAGLVPWVAAAPETVRTLQLRLVRDRAYGVFEVSLGCLVEMRARGAWREALRVLEREVERERPRTRWVRTATTGLSRLLRAQPDRYWIEQVTTRLVDSQAKPAARAAYVRVLGESGARRAATTLRALLRGIYDPAPEVGDDEEREPDPEWVVALRPFSEPLRRYAVRGVGSARAAGDLPLLRRALKDKAWRVRQAALGALAVQLRGAELDVAARIACLDAVVPLLVDGVRRLRPVALRVLRRATGARLPLSYKRWRTFLTEHGRSLRVEALLRREARDDGAPSLRAWLQRRDCASVTDYLRQHDYDSPAAFLAERERGGDE